jgi:hypothetical protein
MSHDAMADDGLDIGIDTMIRDEPGNRIRFLVEQADDPGQIEMRLEVVTRITYWKSLSYFMRVGQQPIEYRRIETKDEVKSAEAIIYTPEILQFGRFELWKGGFMGFGAFVQSLDFNAWANRGRRFRFVWFGDS